MTAEDKHQDLSPTFYDLLDWFAVRMERKLGESIEERGKPKTPEYLNKPVMLLVEGLAEETAELLNAYNHKDAEAVVEEACDVGAFAMFIAHKAVMEAAGDTFVVDNFEPLREFLPAKCLTSESDSDILSTDAEVQEFMKGVGIAE